MQAQADFYEDKVLKKENVRAYLLDNGNMIFSWIDGGKMRKMVLATNHGNAIKDGYLPKQSTTWKDSDTWTTRTAGLFTIKNFKPRQGGVSFHLSDQWYGIFDDKNVSIRPKKI